MKFKNRDKQPKNNTNHSVIGSRDGRNLSWRRTLATLPGIGTGLLPVGFCPACWPVYSGLLASLGVGFLLDSTYILPLTVVFLGLALFALGYRAKSRRGYGPLGVGIVAVGIVLISKFALAYNPLVFLGLALLVAASVWNALPRKAINPSSYTKCGREDQQVNQLSTKERG